MDLRTLLWLLVDVLKVWGVIECLFYVYYRYKLRQLQTHSPPPHFPDEERKRICRQILSYLNKRNAPSFLSDWFFQAPIEQIWQGNVQEWIACALYCTSPDLLTLRERQHLSCFLKQMEARIEHVFPPGHCSTTKCARLTLDPIQAVHRPLFFYCWVWILRWFSSIALWWNGFRYRNSGTLNYWVRLVVPQKNKNKNKNKPLIFIHGIGIGFMPYHRFLTLLWSNQDTYILELPTISMQLVQGNFSMEILVAAIDHLMRVHKVDDATFMGHSFGSICVAWMVKNRPHRVHKAIFLDPVVFLLFLPKICTSFVYSQPSWRAGVLEWIVHFLGKRELFIAHTLARNFWWFQNVIWPEELPKDRVNLVVLSEADQITPAVAIQEFLLKEKDGFAPLTHVLMLRDMKHAEFLFQNQARQLVANTCLEFLI